MADQRMRQAAAGHLSGGEGRVRHLPRLLTREGSPLRAVKQGDRDSPAIHPKAVEKPVGIRRGTMGRTPDREAVSEREGLQPVIPEHHDMRWPFHLGIEARRTVPIVIAGSEQHRTRHLREHRPQELTGIRTSALVLVEIAGEAQRIDPQLVSKLRDPAHRVAQRPPAGLGHHRLGPRERRIQMHIGGVQQADRRHGRTVASGSDKIRRRAYPQPMTVRVTGLDHVVLRVQDVERSLAFYQGVLGLRGEHVEEWRRGETFFPSVRVNDDVIIDILAAPAERPPASGGENVDHFCLVVEPTDWDAVVASGTFDVVDGPATRSGAHGDAQSLYVRDPDRNVVELRYYPA